eukprot:4701085-Pleurochrysis_carterae.AAC.3
MRGDGGWGELLARSLARWRRHRARVACARACDYVTREQLAPTVYISSLAYSLSAMSVVPPRPASTGKITCASKLAAQGI